MKKEFVINEQLLNSIFGYLVSKPYQEVASLIEGLQKEIKPLEDKVEEIKE